MNEGIAWQNKDILMKVLAQTYKGKGFSAYGLNLAPVEQVLPTDFPAILASNLSTDSLFLLEDGSYAMIDYESEYKRSNKIKYLNHIGRVMNRYYKEDEDFHLRMIVIYTGDVKSAEAELETDCITIRTEQAFLSHIDGDAEYQTIRAKIDVGEALTDDDLMKLVILPLTAPGKEEKNRLVEDIIQTAEQVKDDAQKSFILSGTLVATDKFIDKAFAEKIWRMLTMTKIGQIFEREKIEYANQKANETKIEIARSMLAEDIDIIKIMKITGFTEEQLKELCEETFEIA